MSLSFLFTKDLCVYLYFSICSLIFCCTGSPRDQTLRLNSDQRNHVRCAICTPSQVSFEYEYIAGFHPPLQYNINILHPNIHNSITVLV